jgi:cytochrome c oxidase assembly factor CtaG
VSWSLVIHHWHPAWPLDLVTLACACVYLWVAGELRVRWPVLRSVSFLAGLVAVLVALQSGIDTDDERLLSVHMVQHMILLLLAPLLLSLGQPLLLALRALPRGERRALAGALRRVSRYLRPLSCLAVFSAVVVLTHLPGFYDATLRHPALHDAEHTAYLLAGLLMWWPLLDADPVAARRLGGLGRLVYMLAAMPPMALIGAYLNRHATLVYPAYGPPARALHVSALVDQAQAGAIMWVVGGTFVAAVGLWAIARALIAEERRLRVREARAAVAQPEAVAQPGAVAQPEAVAQPGAVAHPEAWAGQRTYGSLSDPGSIVAGRER